MIMIMYGDTKNIIFKNHWSILISHSYISMIMYGDSWISHGCISMNICGDIFSRITDQSRLHYYDHEWKLDQSRLHEHRIIIQGDTLWSQETTLQSRTSPWCRHNKQTPKEQPFQVATTIPDVYPFLVWICTPL